MSPWSRVKEKRGRLLRLLSLMGVSALVIAGLYGIYHWRLSNTPCIPPVQGMIWQPHNGALHPVGEWQKLGIRQLLVQWSAVDEIAYLPIPSLPLATHLPDWKHIASSPWAAETILGLAGYFDEARARQNITRSLPASLEITQLETPLNTVGWYLPVEADPTWAIPDAFISALDTLPRPLWVSIYDNTHSSADELADWIETWLPADVGLFFQDGVGIGVRHAEKAHQIGLYLSNRLGKQRFRMIAEAFRLLPDHSFRPATVNELITQLSIYRDQTLFVFEGPHYLPPLTVDALADRLCSRNH